MSQPVNMSRRGLMTKEIGTPGMTIASARRYVFAPTPEFSILDPDRNLVPGSSIWGNVKSQASACV